MMAANQSLATGEAFRGGSLGISLSGLRNVASRIRAAVVLASLVILSTAPLFGQMNTGELSGQVKDPTGATVASATIEAVANGTQQKYTATSNDSGEFLLAQLPVGEYTVSVSAMGFKKAVQSGIAVHAGDKLRQTFSLELGDQTQSVTVTGEAGLLQTESAAIKDTVQQAQVIDLPLKGRQFIDLVSLAPGTTTPPAGTRGSALQQTGQTYGILGQRGGHNLYLVDGSSVTDEAFNNLVLSPSVDGIQEVNINQTSYDAEFGGKSGGIINVISKNGSNQFHGSLFEFVRNDIFDAENFFVKPTQSKPPYKQNQFGASLGGPIQQNKTFFFVDYEGERIRKGVTQTFVVPTAAEAAGNFQGSGITLTNPATGTPFINNTITTIDPVAAAVLAKVAQGLPGGAFPTTTGANATISSTQLSKIGINQYNTRIDHTFGANDTVFVRGSVFDDNEFDPFGSGAINETLLPGFGYNLRTHTDNLSATWSHVFSPSWLNEARFGWMWVGGGQVSPNAGINFAGQTGLQGVSSNTLDTGYPDVAITGFTTLGESTQYVSRKDNDYEVYDNVLWHHGTHTVKFGAYFFHLDFEPINANNARGTFTFSSTSTFVGTGNALGNFLIGDPTQGSGSSQGRGNLLGRTNWVHLYVEDGWQITPSLKLDIGLRYEYNQNMTDANNNASIINILAPGGQIVVASNAQGSLSSLATSLIPAFIPANVPVVTSQQANWNNSLLSGRPIRLAPRIGIAWSLPDNKTVIRSGFGIYTNQAAYNIIQNEALNPPFYYAKTVNNSLVGGLPAHTTENILTASGSVSGNNLNHDFKIEYNNVWNLSIEHSLSSTTSLQAQYIGSYTVHADNYTLQNLFPNSALQAGPAHVRPIPSMSGFQSVTWDGWEKYHALTVTLTQHMWRGLIVNSNYTWSKALDDASNPGPDNAGPNLPQDPSNLAAEKGLSDFDHRNRFVTNFLYQIPFLKNSQGWIHTAFGGWQVGGIWTLQSGAPFNINISTDTANNGEPLSAPSQRPNLSCNPNNGPKTTAQWFNVSCFSLPAAFTYGNAGRDIVTGPGLDDFDTTLQKQFLLRENMNLEFRLDVFDFFNHPNFNAPVGAGRTYSTSSSFGQITSANDPRDMQFSLRLAF